MAFTDQDREKLTEAVTTVNLMREAHERRLTELEQSDKEIHTRVNEVHGRINKVRNTLSAIYALGMGLFGYLKIKTGG